MQVVDKKCLNGQEVAENNKKGRGEKIVKNVILAVVSVVIFVVLAVFIAKVISITIEKNAAKLAAFEKHQNLKIQEEATLQGLIEKNR